MFNVIIILSILLTCFIFYYFKKLATADKKLYSLKSIVKTHLLTINESIKSQMINCDNVAKCFADDFYKQPPISPAKIEVDELLRIPDDEIRGVYFEKIAANDKLTQADKDALTKSYTEVIHSLNDLKLLNFDLNKNIDFFLKDFEALRTREEKVESVFRKEIHDLLKTQPQLDYKRDLFHFLKIDRDELLKIRGSELQLPSVAYITAMAKCEKVNKDASVKLAVQEMNNVYDEAPKLQVELKELRNKHLNYFANSKLELQNSSIKVEIMADYFKNT